MLWIQHVIYQQCLIHVWQFDKDQKENMIFNETSEVTGKTFLIDK